VLRELEQLVRGSSRSLQLRRAIHAARLEPALHPIRANEALETLRRASPGHPLVEDLTRLLEGGDLRSRLGLPAGADDGETRQGAIDLAVRARRTAALASSGAEEVAGEAVAQFCMLILQRLT
jgi:hypothetical protein